MRVLYSIFVFMFILFLAIMAINDKSNCLAKSFYFAMRNYALDHNNNYPQSAISYQHAISKLFPEYSSVFGGELLGGVNSPGVELVDKKFIEDNTSWVYVMGYTTQMPEKLILLWNNNIEFIHKSCSCGGAESAYRLIIYLDGKIDCIENKKWRKIVQEQLELLGDNNISPKNFLDCLK